jgi:hypothetical protein
MQEGRPHLCRVLEEKHAGLWRGRTEFMNMARADEKRCSLDPWKGVLLSAERGSKGGAKKAFDFDRDAQKEGLARPMTRRGASAHVTLEWVLADHRDFSQIRAEAT